MNARINVRHSARPAIRIIICRGGRARIDFCAPTLYVCSGRELVGASNYFLMSRSVGGNLFWVSSLIFQQCAFNGIGTLPARQTFNINFNFMALIKMHN
jgi:hypothetical protein